MAGCHYCCCSCMMLHSCWGSTVDVVGKECLLVVFIIFVVVTVQIHRLAAVALVVVFTCGALRGTTGSLVLRLRDSGLGTAERYI